MTNNFEEVIWQQGQELYRDMPWRRDTRPYYVLVSELMLQQTQVDRVIPKFQAFIKEFPNERSLAEASLAEVLKFWQGLGYNRRAKFLHEAVKMIVNQYDGVFPENEADLLKLPGVGKNTAGAICAYAFNRPSLFVETNIRTVYIHHFFNDQFEVDDKQITEKMKETVSWAKGKEQPDKFSHKFDGARRKTVGLSYEPRAFYWALMDYGSWLKANGVRNTSRSKHYRKQAPLKGSLREARGAILRHLTTQDMKVAELQKVVNMSDRFTAAVDGLIRDGLIIRIGDYLHLTK